MTRVTKSTVKQQWPASWIQWQRSKIESRVSRRPEEVAAARNQLQQEEIRKHERVVRRRRVERLCAAVLGPRPVYTGRITIPDGFAARAPDEERLSDIAMCLKMIPTIVYWVDGSYVGLEGQHAGFMGAGVVWQERAYQCTSSYRLGRDVGNNVDAEVFAIAAALGLAKKTVERAIQKGKDGENYLKLVRIYSDSKCVLEELAKNTLHILGPLLTKRTALEAIYDRTAWLTTRGVRVELIWVKGHAKSEGNKEADRLATRAIRDQIDALQQGQAEERVGAIGQMKTAADVPDIFKELGNDWVDEWLSRANVSARSRAHALTKRQRHWLQHVVDGGAENEDEDVFTVEDDVTGAENVDVGDQILAIVTAELDDFDDELQLERQIQEDIALREESLAMFG